MEEMEMEQWFRFPHEGVRVSDGIRVSTLYTIHFFINEMDYPAPGELHDFWELLYVDAGQIEVYLERQDRNVILKQGDLVIIRPEEYHCFFADESKAYSLFILSFDTGSKEMECFYQKNLFETIPFERQMIGEILRETRRNFLFPLDKITPNQIRLRPGASPDCLQKIRGLLEILLLELRRNALDIPENTEDQGHELSSNPYVAKAIAVMKENLDEKLSLREISERVGLSAAYLQKLFHNEIGLSIIRYYRHLRMGKAKYYIRARRMTISEIAERMGFSSVHHFSTCFYQTERMWPTQYIKTVQSWIDGEAEGIVVSERRR